MITEARTSRGTLGATVQKAIKICKTRQANEGRAAVMFTVRDQLHATISMSETNKQLGGRGGNCTLTTNRGRMHFNDRLPSSGSQYIENIPLAIRSAEIHS